MAKVAADEAVASLARATAELERRAAAHALAAERLARPATVGIYSAAARMAFDAIEATLREGRTLFVHAPAGTDAVPYVARAHLATARRREPLVVVDGTSTREHDPSRWLDPSVSPLALADRGLLLLVNGAALPVDIQRILAAAHEAHRAPWDAVDAGLDFALAITATAPRDALVESGRLDPSLASRLADAVSCALPRLRDRPEDLRAIVSDRLAREGLRVRGAPVGIEDAAFARLLDYPFEGEDAELAWMARAWSRGPRPTSSARATWTRSSRASSRGKRALRVVARRLRVTACGRPPSGARRRAPVVDGGRTPRRPASPSCSRSNAPR